MKFFNPNQTKPETNIMTETKQFPWEDEAAAPTAKKGKSKPAAAPSFIVTDLEPVAAGEGPSMDGMPRADLPAIRANIESQLTVLLTDADAINVTSIDQTDLMAQAREKRLQIRSVRLFVEKKHKELKAYHLQAGREVDAFKNHFLELCEVREERLKLAEDFAEIETARIQAELRVNRLIELQPFLMEGQRPQADLGLMTEKEWTDHLTDAKDLHALRVAREARERKEREDAEQAERERIERERQEQEAERVRLREAADRAARELAAEREAAALERAKREDEMRKEREAMEAERRKAQAAIDEERRQAQAEADRLEGIRRKEQAAADEERRKAQAEIQRMERERQEDRRKADEAAAKARAEADRIQAEADRREAEQRLAAVRAEQEKAEAARRAAVAPDKEKLAAFAKQVQELAVPRLSPAASGTESLIAEKTQAFARWILGEAAKL